MNFRHYITLLAALALFSAGCSYTQVVRLPDTVSTDAKLPLKGYAEARIGPYVSGEACRSGVLFFRSGKSTVGTAMLDALKQAQPAHTLFNPIIEKQFAEYIFWGKRCVFVSGSSVKFVFREEPILVPGATGQPPMYQQPSPPLEFHPETEPPPDQRRKKRRP